MSFLQFIISLLWIISFDVLFGFLLFIVWKYFDLKYFSTTEIEMLKDQVKYLQEENKKCRVVDDSIWKEGL